MEIANLLLTKGATVIANNSRLANLLCTVGFEGDMKRLELLHKAGCNLEIADYDSRTLGHLAASEGQIDMLQYLSSRTDFNFNLRDRWDNTPMMELQDENQKVILDVFLNSRMENKS